MLMCNLFKCLWIRSFEASLKSTVVDSVAAGLLLWLLKTETALLEPFLEDASCQWSQSQITAPKIYESSKKGLRLSMLLPCQWSLTLAVEEFASDQHKMWNWTYPMLLDLKPNFGASEWTIALSSLLKPRGKEYSAQFDCPLVKLKKSWCLC